MTDTNKEQPERIRIDTQAADPKLNPNSPDFDLQLYEEKVIDNDSLKRVQATLNSMAEKISTTFGDAAAVSLKAAGEKLKKAGDELGLKKVLEESQSLYLKMIPATIWRKVIYDRWQDIIDGQTSFREIWEKSRPVLEEIDELQPYLEDELQKPEYKDFTLEEITANSELWEKALAAAREEKSKRQLPSTVIKRANKIDFPIDKVNAEIWDLLQENTHGQLKFEIPVEKQGSKNPINIIYSIDFDKLECSGAKITKRLTETDKRVYVAVAALFNAGNDIVSLTQIHYAMGNTKNPAPNQTQKIRDSLEKMGRAWVTINNLQEVQANYKYGDCGYSGNLMHIEIIDRYNIQGGISESAIHVMAEPALITFARKRKQITTVPVKVLQSPISKTESNLAIEGYLIERIARAKNGKGKGKILYKTICEHTNITNKKQQSRVPEKVQRYLKHYAECGHIEKYTAAKDGVTIYF